ncbi:MAG: efflux RND transporter periplasmic adaptor subunit [Deltaproteobacteria bacterium]|nr:efflux RND transporter periplasmic adaptor subunit [Deltaproteobacteria bacterium]MBW2360766.1 efflux RND transporter periplasmic adaptor subunit [Deltaproteobacteria bacterium]
MSWPKPQRTPLVVLCIAGGVALLALWGILTSDAATKARERDARLAESHDAGPTAGAPTLQVSVMTVRRAPAADVVELAGVLEPVRATWVAAELAGRIVEVPAAEHAPLQAGAVLVRLDPALPQADLIRAEASHRLAQAERKRQENLGQRSIASAAELDRAVAEERRAWAAVLEARTRLGHTRITAPFDGLVNSLDLDPGAYVQPGTPIAEVLDVSSVEVSVPVSDRQVGAVKVGDAAQVRIDALGSEAVAGRVVRVGRAPQQETQRYPIVVELANPDGRLLPGMLAHVALSVGNEPSLRIPARAVVREFELDYVFVLEGAETVRRVRVATRPVPFRPDQVEVRSGLEDDARVVVTAVSQLRDGMRVLLP